MSAMVEQMLSLARSGGARRGDRAVLRPLDLAELAREVTAKWRAARRTAGYGRRGGGGARAGPGDELSLERCLYNIVEMQSATPRAGGRVSVSVTRHGGHVW